MKIKSLCAATLVTIITAGTLGAPLVDAAPQSLKSAGTVTVTDGNGGGGIIDPTEPTEPTNPLIPVPEPTDPTDPTNPITPNPEIGPLMIDAASNLNFGEIQAGSEVSGKAANPLTVAGKNYPHLVQWTDARAGAQVGYTVSAEMTKPFTNAAGTSTIAGATIDYSDAKIIQNVTNTNTAPSLALASFTLGAAKQDVVKQGAAAAGDLSAGKGVFQLNFGTADAPGVKLNASRSATSSLNLERYTAEITWSIASVE